MPYTVCRTVPHQNRNMVAQNVTNPFISFEFELFGMWSWYEPIAIWALNWVVYARTNNRTKLFEMKDLALKLLIHYIERVLFGSRIIYLCVFDANGLFSIWLLEYDPGRTLYAINVHSSACNRIKWNKQMGTMFDFQKIDRKSMVSPSFGSLH